MKRSSVLFMAAGIAAFSFTFSACGNKEQSGTGTATEPMEQTANQAAEKVEYTCPMHPEVLSNTPGECPTCGMALEPKSSVTPTDSGSHEGHEH